MNRSLRNDAMDRLVRAIHNGATEDRKRALADLRRADPPRSRELDKLAAGADGPAPQVPRPRPGERCPRCHRKNNRNRCQLCNPGDSL